MNTTDKTAEEILNKYGFILGYSVQSNTETSYKNLLAAMEEYARLKNPPQEVKPALPTDEE